ncbi:hypothetical protein IJ531_02255, partial [bacterium]|nr:hypothetical protein [bacterium]
DDGSSKEVSYDKDGSVREKRQLDRNGDVKTTSYYSKSNQFAVDVDNNNGSYSYSIYDTDEKGKKINDSYTLSPEQYIRINHGALLDYPNLSLSGVFYLSKLDEAQWQQALSYLQANPDADYWEIMENVDEG